jgi:hypothetical protein
MSTTRDALTKRDGERYTEQQLVEILRRAAERQEGLTSEADGRFSLAEIQQFASEVGIDPAHVAVAAAELAHSPQPPPSTALGAPIAFRFERWLDGEIPTSAIGELFDVARRETGLQGQVSEALDTVEWRGRGLMGATVVSVARRGGRTQISVYLARTDAAALVATTTGVGGLIGAAAIGTVLAASAAAAGTVGVLGAVAVSLGWGGAGSWLAMRGIWRRVARRWASTADALGNELVAVAQRAIDAARNDSE